MQSGPKIVHGDKGSRAAFARWHVHIVALLITSFTSPVAAYDKREGEAFHNAYWRCEKVAKQKSPTRFADARACLSPLVGQAKEKKTKVELAYRMAEWQEREAGEDRAALTNARGAFLQVAASYPGEEMAVRARFRAARLLEDSLGDPKAADAEYRGIVRDSPNAIAALNALVHAEQALPNDRERVHFYERELTARPNSALAPVLLERMGILAMASPDLAQRAVKVFDVLGRREGAKNDNALYYGAKARVVLGDYDGAVKRLEELCATKEVSPIPSALLPGDLHSSRMDDARFLLGEIMRDKLNDPKRAEHHFRLLVEESPESRLVDDALHAMEELLRARGDTKGAAAVHKQLTEKRPESRFLKATAPSAKAATP